MPRAGVGVKSVAGIKRRRAALLVAEDWPGERLLAAALDQRSNSAHLITTGCGPSREKLCGPLAPRTMHAWRNPGTGKLRFRGTMTPGHPGFETFFRVWCGLARDGAVRPSGLPRRFADLALLVEMDPSVASGPLRLVAPLMRWSARRERERGRAAALLHRYGCDVPPADVSA